MRASLCVPLILGCSFSHSGWAFLHVLELRSCDTATFMGTGCTCVSFSRRKSMRMCVWPTCNILVEVSICLHVPSLNTSVGVAVRFWLSVWLSVSALPAPMTMTPSPRNPALVLARRSPAECGRVCDWVSVRMRMRMACVL